MLGTVSRSRAAGKSLIRTGTFRDQGLYSYPGPKPQTKEAALLMLADGIEAATRTIAEPTHDRIQGLVQKMINKAFKSGQLNECDLTLRDLHQIAAVFTRILTGIYHQRIAYAEPAEKVGEKFVAQAGQNGQESAKDESGRKERKELAGAAVDKKQRSEAEQVFDEEDDPEDLKRLGM